jgi:flagellar biosynthesis GTPase FlhF
MELKRILARDTRSATEKAISMYGPDVLIISNTRVEGQTELIVAMDISETVMEEVSEDQTIEATSSMPMTSASSSPREILSSTPSSVNGRPAPKAGFDAHLHQVLKPEAKAPKGVPSSTEQILTQGRDQVRSQEIVSLVREELAALRQEFRLSQQTASWQMNQYWPQHIQPLVQAMAEASVPTALRALLQEGLREQPSLEAAIESLRAQLTHNLARPQEGFASQGVHVFAGLSGSGKSLMTARVAYQMAMNHGADNVAVVSYHDLRAGAWSQTQMLCSQVGVDCFRAADAATLKLLLEELSHKKLILIDTPGVQMTERLVEITTVCPDVGLHAVVPADSSGVTLSRIMVQSQLKWQSLMISKLDESNSPWPLIQFLTGDGAHYMVSAGAGSDKVTEGLKSSGLKKLINIAISQLTPPEDTLNDVMIEASLNQLPETEVLTSADEISAHTVGLSRPNWSVQIPQSELHG